MSGKQSNKLYLNFEIVVNTNETSLHTPCYYIISINPYDIEE